jgi:hypothetical protein
VDSFREESKKSPVLFLEKHSGSTFADFEKDRIMTTSYLAGNSKIKSWCYSLMKVLCIFFVIKV